MARNLIVGAAQLGPISRSETRASSVDRMIKLMEEAKLKGVQLIVFPELALTTFFPRWFIEDQEELDSFFETEVPGPETSKLFDKAKELNMGFYLGFAEITEEDGKVKHFNTSILVDNKGTQIGKYQKIHLPGHFQNEHYRAFQYLEKRYFDLIGGTCIIAPTGEIVAECKTLDDELIVYQCDLDRCEEIKKGIFDFAQHREPENYRLIVETKGEIS